MILLPNNELSQPLAPATQGILDTLEEITDLHFVFLTGAPVDPEKFSEAYRGTSYALSDDPSWISGIFESIHYDRVMYPGQHLLWFVAELTELEESTPGTIKKIIENSEVLKKSVFSITRLTTEELFENYKGPRPEGSSWKFWKTASVDRGGTYDTHKVDSRVIILRPALVDLVMDYDKKRPAYTETFTDYDRFIGSVVHRIPGALDEVLKQHPSDVKVNTDRQKPGLA